MKPFPSHAFEVKNSINPLQNNSFIFWVFICLLLITKGVFANGSIPLSTVEESLFSQKDSTKDTSSDTASIKIDTTISEDAIKSKVKYQSKDSMTFDMETGKVYLWNDAEVYYEDIVLKADYIELDMNSSLVIADGLVDSTGEMQGMPVFKDKGSDYQAGRMVYNFKTKRGKISEVRTQEGDGYIKGNEVRKTPTDVIYVKNGYYTTCNLEHPHFSLATNKLKVIPGEKIIAGPTVLKIGEVPTPLGLPFGIFPNTKERSSGILIPSYGDSQTRGFFLTDFGYYFGISDNIDLVLTADVYSKGSWGANLISNYKKRYRFGGKVDLEYNKILNSYPEFPNYSETQDFFLRWYHSLDQKASPYSSFSANVNIGTNSNFKNNINSSNQEYLSNVFQSNISYSKRFPGKPFNFTASARHSQNTRTGAFNLTLPAVSFSVNRQMPFRNWLRGGSAFRNFGFSYSANATNELRTQDTLLSLNNIENLKGDFSSGVVHTLPFSTSMKVFKYFNLNPSITFRDVWAFRSIRKSIDPESGLQKDTISGFVRGGNMVTSANLSTKIYGMYQFHSGKIKAIRHVLTPQLSFNYVPENKSGLRSFEDTAGQVVEYSIFEDAIYGKPNREERGIIGFNLMNNLEMKVKTDKDSSGLKKIKLFESLSLFSSYDIAADSLNLSPFVIEGRTRITDNINFQFDGTFDPYMLDSSGIKIDRLMIDQTGSLGRLTSARFSLNFVLRGGNKKDRKEKESDLASEEQMDYINSHPEQFVDFNIPWSLRLGYNWIYTKPRFDKEITQTLNFSGDIKVTENWKVGFTSGWDFEKSDFSYTSMNIYRNLHCWEMSVRVIPFGRRQSYVFTINVKSPVLQDLKLNRRRNYYDVIR